MTQFVEQIGITYSNSCRLYEATCYKPTLKVAHKGPCGDSTISPTIRPIKPFPICPKPMCAYDPNGKPFCASKWKNILQSLLLFICSMFDKTLKIVHEGPCEGIQQLVHQF